MEQKQSVKTSLHFPAIMGIEKSKQLSVCKVPTLHWTLDAIAAQGKGL